MPNGIIIIDKPTGWTSMDVCAKLRGVFHEKRVGHGGTLDPMATGVLPVFLGRATRAVECAAGGDKEYVAGLRLGLSTDTQDITGAVLEQRPVNVSRADVEGVLDSFRGDILQIPPMYSAVKIDGKKLYQLARKGRDIERPPRPVAIHSLTIESGEGARYQLRIRCSKGTYIRTLCHDIGAALGCGGCMDSLRRTMAAGYTEGEAHALEEVLSAPNPAVLLRPVDSCFNHLPALTLTPAQSKCVRNGRGFTWSGPPGDYRTYGPDGEFLALSCVRDGTMTTIKSFFQPE